MIYLRYLMSVSVLPVRVMGSLQPHPAVLAKCRRKSIIASKRPSVGLADLVTETSDAIGAAVLAIPESGQDGSTK